jgi:hypothetical protein
MNEKGLSMPAYRWIVGSVALAMTLLIASTGRAELIVRVTQSGAPAGQTLWSFSGSSTYGQMAPGGKFAGGELANVEEWKGDAGSDYVKPSTYNNFTTSLVSGAVSLMVTPLVGSPSSGSIGGLHIDHDNSGDDFGVGLLGADIPLSQGDVVTWSGSAIFAVDLANLNLGSFSFTSLGGSQAVSGQIYGTLPITLNISVPEIDPASMTAAFSLLLGSLGLIERRRSSAR